MWPSDINGFDGTRPRTLTSYEGLAELMTRLMDQAADGVWLVTGTDVNWVVVADADEVTLVDTGEPRDLTRVRSSLERIGRTLQDVSAIVITHAHPDHIGAAERLRAECGIPVRLLAAEAPHARGQTIEEASKLQVLRAAWRPQVLAWGLRILRAVQRGPNASPRSSRLRRDPARLTCRGAWCRSRPWVTPAGIVPFTCPSAACSSPAMP